MNAQSRIAAWMSAVFDEATAANAAERSLRTAEEALELAQACGIKVEVLHRLVDYVFSRPTGKPAQEIAGTMVTLYSAAHALGVDADAAFEAEFERIQQPEVIERCRRRQDEKRAALVGGIEKKAPPTDPWRDVLPRCHRLGCSKIGVKWIARHVLYCDQHGSSYLQDAPWAALARNEGL